jgi:hypothetical protein
MSFITAADLKHLLNPGAGEKCVSLYQTTFMVHPEAEQNPIQYKVLLKQLETELAAHFKGRDYKPVLEAFAPYVENPMFWRYRTPGLAMFWHAGHLHVFDVPRPVPNTVVVADSFHLKPIFRVLQTTDRYNVLTLERNQALLFEANRDAIIPISLADMPTHPKEHDTGARTRVAEQHFSGFGRAVVSIHDTDEKSDDAAYFHQVDQFVDTNLSKRTHLPLVLVALSEHQGTFRKHAKNPLLLPEGVSTSPTHMEPAELREKTFAVMEKYQHEFVRKQLDNVEAAKAHGKGATDLADIAVAAVAGRVGTLLVDADKKIPGFINPSTGIIEKENLAHPEIDDVLDDLMELVFRTEGTVLVLPHDLMPVDSGVAAVYRF